MSCSNINSSCNGISDILSIILKLQECDKGCCDINEGCDRPFLGPTPSIICFNTRPFNLYRCSDGELWSLPYTFNGTTGVSNIFRVENLDGCCCTCRILIPNDLPESEISPYIATDSFFTINLNCVCAISCLPDVFVNNV